jgi:hypothetical protein
VAESLKGLPRHARVAAVVIAPLLASAGVLHGLRGEARRIEDKLDSKDLRSVAFNIRAQQGAQQCWQGRTLALVEH